MNNEMEIVVEKNVIDDHLLDIIGNEFKFSHEKGLAEWIKNSVDAYIRNDTDDEKSQIVLQFSDNNDEITFECIDYVGMTTDDINKALKRWGDPDAAKRGTSKRVLGGHGNGGKFYMRQMFDHANYITYRNGYLNVFGFDKNKRYGFAKGLKEKKMTLNEAIKFAGIDSIVEPQDISSIIQNSSGGFTVARGYKPKDILKRNFRINRFFEKIRHFSQTRRILKYRPVTVMYNDSIFTERLMPEEIKPMIGFEQPIEVKVPVSIPYTDDDHTEEIILSNSKYEVGELKLFTSNEPLSRNSRLGELNTIDIIGIAGVIASYRLSEIGFISNLNASEFIYGECFCPILENEENDCVKNDRSTLVDNNITRALRKWIGEQVDRLAAKIVEKERREVNKKNIETLSDINNILNEWKNDFMDKVVRDILGGSGVGPGSGIGSGGNRGGKSSEKNNGGNGVKNTGEGKKDGGGESNKKPKQTYPRILLSGINADPLTGIPLALSERHEPVYQRPWDSENGIYWINTSRKLAQYIINRYGVKSTKWRDYHLQRVIDVICKEALYKLFKQDPDNFTPETVDGEIINKLIGKAHDSAIDKLSEYLFEPEYKTPHEELSEKIAHMAPEEQTKFISDIEEAIALIKEEKV